MEILIDMGQRFHLLSFQFTDVMIFSVQIKSTQLFIKLLLNWFPDIIIINCYYYYCCIGIFMLVTDNQYCSYNQNNERCWERNLCFILSGTPIYISMITLNVPPSLLGTICQIRTYHDLSIAPSSSKADYLYLTLQLQMRGTYDFRSTPITSFQPCNVTTVAWSTSYLIIIPMRVLEGDGWYHLYKKCMRIWNQPAGTLWHRACFEGC